MGYTHIYAPDMNRTDYSRQLLDDVLRDCLVRLNRNLPVMAIDEAILKPVSYTHLYGKVAIVRLIRQKTKAYAEKFCAQIGKSSYLCYTQVRIC